MADSVDLESMQERLNRCSVALQHPPDRVEWKFCPSLGIAWQSPGKTRVNDFLYQEIRSRLVRRIPHLANLPTLGSSLIGRLGVWGLRVVSAPGPRMGKADVVTTFGRRRTRILDFEGGLATTVDQPGVKTIASEVAARSEGDARLTTTILEHSTADGIMVEQLELGFNLAVHGKASGFRGSVQGALHEWRRGTIRRVSHTEYVDLIAEESPQTFALAKMQELLDQSSNITNLAVSASHGDLQPSNVLRTPTGSLLLLDFEHYATRWAGYDMAVFCDGLRWARRAKTQPVLLEIEELRFEANQSDLTLDQWPQDSDL